MTTSEPETETDTDDGGGVCDAYCQMLGMCEGEGAAEVCAVECSLQLELYENLGTCHPLYSELVTCLGRLDCDEHEQYLAQEGDFPCENELDGFGASFGAPLCALEDPPAGCIPFCETIVSCSLGEDIEACIIDCAWLFASSEIIASPGCVAALTIELQCKGAADCAVFDDPMTCAEESAAVLEFCPL